MKLTGIKRPYGFYALIIALLTLPAHAIEQPAEKQERKSITVAPESASLLAPLTFSRLYELTWNGLPFGNMAIEGREAGPGYSLKAQIRFTGVIRIFASHESTTSVSSTGPDPFVSGRVYETHYRIKKKAKHIKLAFKPGGGVGEELVEPPDGPDRPAVPPELKFASTDMLSLIPAMRNAVQDARQTGKRETNLRLYDGKRLMEIALTVMGRERVVANGEQVPVLKARLKRSPVAGFTEKELRKFNEGEPDVFVYFSDDAMLLPVKAEMQTLLGKVEAELGKECAPETPCGL